MNPYSPLNNAQDETSTSFSSQDDISEISQQLRNMLGRMNVECDNVHQKSYASQASREQVDKLAGELQLMSQALLMHYKNSEDKHKTIALLLGEMVKSMQLNYQKQSQYYQQNQQFLQNFEAKFYQKLAAVMQRSQQQARGHRDICAELAQIRIDNFETKQLLDEKLDDILDQIKGASNAVMARRPNSPIKPEGQSTMTLEALQHKYDKTAPARSAVRDWQEALSELFNKQNLRKEPPQPTDKQIYEKMADPNQLFKNVVNGR